MLCVTLWVSLATALAGCSGEREEEASTSIAMAVPEVVAEQDEAPVVDSGATAEPDGPTLEERQVSPRDVARRDAVLPRAPLTSAEASADVGAQGGLLVAGAMEVSVPESALSDTRTFSIAVHESPDALSRPLPPGFLLGAYSGSPWNPEFSRPVSFRLPLGYKVPIGSELELLAWQPGLKAFIVIDRSRVESSGHEVTFRARQLGDMVVRGRPERREDYADVCDGPVMRVRDVWPGGTESSLVGLVEIEERTPRDHAFNVLTDFRIAPEFGLVNFKNEEEQNLSYTRRNELAHRDEDFLMDPNAAAALVVLARLVADEWSDPFTGEPATFVRVTDAYDALIEHSQRSTHYEGRALDLTLSPVPAATGRERGEMYGRLSTLATCSGFDYVLFENDAHAHASVVRSEVAFAVRTEAGYEVYSAPLVRTDRAVSTGVRWEGTAEELTEFRWLDEGRFEVVDGASTANPQRYTLTRRGMQPIDTPAAEESGVVPVAHVGVAPPARHGDAVTVDGLRQLLVHDGVAYLSNTVALPPPGSVNLSGEPIHIHFPLPLTAPDLDVVAAAFRDHPPTRAAFSRYILGRE